MPRKAEPAVPAGPVEVTIRSMGGEKICQFEIEPDTSVSAMEVMYNMRRDFGYPLESQQLFERGVILADHCQLEALPEPINLTLVLKKFDKLEALRHAVRHASEAAVRSLLVKVARDSNETVELLTASSRREDGGSTVLHIAAERGHPSICRALLAVASRPELCCWMLKAPTLLTGWTPLHMAAYRGQDKTCDVLLETAHNLGVRRELLMQVTIEGWTALHAAARGGHNVVCKRLLAVAAADDLRKRMLTHTDPHAGFTALQIAEREGYATVSKTLRSAVRALEAPPKAVAAR